MPEAANFNMRCIKGESWPISSYRCVGDLAIDPPTPKSITIACPAEHSFILAQAVEKCLCSEEDAIKMLGIAKQVVKEAKKEYNERWNGKRWIDKPSDFVPNEEVLAKKWPCVKCKKRLAIQSLGQNDKEHALCANCRADWGNYDEHDALRMLDCTHGKPRDLFWEMVFRRFCNGEPPLSHRKAKLLLNKCRQHKKRMPR